MKMMCTHGFKMSEDSFGRLIFASPYKASSSNLKSCSKKFLCSLFSGFYGKKVVRLEIYQKSFPEIPILSFCALLKNNLSTFCCSNPYTSDLGLQSRPTSFFWCFRYFPFSIISIIPLFSIYHHFVVLLFSKFHCFSDNRFCKQKDVVPVSLSLTLNIYHTFFYCFYYWHWADEYLLRT